MQTFLPVESFVQSMEMLDWARLGKQRVEAGQILEMLTGEAYFPKNIQLGTEWKFRDGWTRHPATRMWAGHTEWLKLYLACAIGEWCFRGYRNSMPVPVYDTSLQPRPAWLGNPAFHLSHQSNLIRKAPAHYSHQFPDVGPDLPYFWPHKEGY